MKTTDTPVAPEICNQLYDSRFFSNQSSVVLESGKIILARLFEHYKAASVLDVGAGQGAWLSAAELLGSQRLVGLDGPWVDTKALLSKQIEFLKTNLEKPFRTNERFDLCISVEVAEHLSAERAESFVEDLCAAAPVVLFSAAIPQQGGIRHINEQPQSYWAALFRKKGYGCYDIIRPQVWDDCRVASWYRQNILVYVRDAHPFSSIAGELQKRVGPLDVVHPEVFEGNLDNYKKAIDAPTLRFCCHIFAKWAKRQIKKVG